MKVFATEVRGGAVKLLTWPSLKAFYSEGNSPTGAGFVHFATSEDLKGYDTPTPPEPRVWYGERKQYVESRNLMHAAYLKHFGVKS